jgi:hypothetical protein
MLWQRQKPEADPYQVKLCSSHCQVHKQAQQDLHANHVRYAMLEDPELHMDAGLGTALLHNENLYPPTTHVI